jgi:hypothetical protein
MIHLVGLNHKDPRHDTIIRKYVFKAAKNELVVFLEGFPSDTNKLKKYLQQFFGISEGLVFGCECEIANAICRVLLNLGYCRSPNMKEEARMGNLQTCYDIIMVDEVRSAWNKIPQHIPFIASVNKIIQGYNITNVKQMVNDIYTKHKSILEDPGWIDIYKYLYDNLIKEVPPTLQVPFNDPRVREYLNSGQNVGEDYVVNEINLNWRNDFIVKNISDTIKSNKLDNKEIFIFIGSGHIEGMNIPLKKYFGKVNIVEDANKLP